MSTPDTHRLFTTHKVPLRYLVIPKCGCTFVKNLLWRIENGADHTQPIRVHDDDSRFLRASELGLTEEDIRKENHAFTVIRNPVDRFFSLYTDKVIGPGWEKYVPLRKTLMEGYGLNPDLISAEGHRANCEILIDWLERNLRDEIDLPKEAHWTPQHYRGALIKKFDLKILILKDIADQLPVLVRDLLPDIEQTLAGLEENRSAKPVAKGDILVPELRKRINTVYARDRDLFQKARDAWAGLDPATAGNADVPRISGLLG